MLRSLHLRNYVIVDEVEIDFSPGFTVFTGETGAGKSILIDVIGLLMGDRAEAGVVRPGADRCELSLSLSPSPSLHQWLCEQDLDAEELVIRRVLETSGRSKAYLNGRPASLAELKIVGEHMIDIHGQHAHQQLLKGESQRRTLDEFGQLLPQVAQVHEAWQTLSRATSALNQHAQNQAQVQTRRNELDWLLEQLNAVQVGSDEWETIQIEHKRLANAQTLQAQAQQALNALDDAEPSILTQLNRLIHNLSAQQSVDERLAPVNEALDSARIGVEEATSALRHYSQLIELDPARLQEVEARLAVIFDLSRKLKLSPQELHAHHAALLAEQQGLGDARQDHAALVAAQAAAQQNYEKTAQALRAARLQQAQTLAHATTDLLRTLGMAQARFEIEVDEAAAGPYGIDQVRFTFAAHPGMPVKALSKVASGGELSRISLALSVAATGSAQLPTLIFDEVDSGVGGAVADIIGQRMRELGESHQVLCVTHLAQVASQAHQHFKIQKLATPEGVRSEIQPLNDASRVEEIARMIGGVRRTDATLAHARELIER